jgi:heat-inducible transcriptional repressor
MAETTGVSLSERQREVLRRVVEEYVVTGQPVGSKTLVARSAMTVSSSTVRSELAVLEEHGLLTHPHTSAGRVPTEVGYRYYADELLEHIEPQQPREFPLDLSSTRTEIESALRATTEMLSQVNRLLALVSAPPLEATTVRQVEVLLLQPQVVMALVITSAGGVTKRVVQFDEPVDPGLAVWAAEYLNETVAGLQLGTTLLRRRFEDPGLSVRERMFLETLRPAFTELLAPEQRLFVGGAAELFEDLRADELEPYRRVLELLEKRAEMLEVLGDSFDPRKPFVRVGRDLEGFALHNVALVGACYGLVHRSLGAVSLIGPLRMDYEKAIRSVRAAAIELSRFVESVFEAD